MTTIGEATLAQIADLFIKANQDLTTFSFAVREAVPELLRRLDEDDRGPLNLDAVLEWLNTDAEFDELEKVRDLVLDAIEAEEAGGADEWGFASDRYDGEWYADAVASEVPPTHVIDETMDARDIREELRGKDGSIVPGTTVVVSGVINGLRIGGGHTYAISNADGSPVPDLRFTFEPGARIDGLKFGASKGGVNGEIRFVEPTFRAASNGSGDEIGDFAPVRLLDEMPDMHIVMINPTVEVDPSWTGYDGMGIKWAFYLRRCKATFTGVEAAPAREHTYYFENTVDLFVENAVNTTRAHTDAAGVTRELGNGRTFAQIANRVEQKYPKGGPPSTGRAVFLGCQAVRCGWEGQLAWTDKEGSVHAGNPNAGGGSDFTCHGHTGEVVAIINCSSVDPFAGSVACWNEPGKDNKTEANPLGLRCWMMGDGGNLINPLDVMRSLAWGTDRFVVSNFEVTGERGPKQRPAFQVSGARFFEGDGMRVNGEEVVVGHPQLRVNHQAGVTPVETVEVSA